MKYYLLEEYFLIHEYFDDLLKKYKTYILKSSMLNINTTYSVKIKKKNKMIQNLHMICEISQYLYSIGSNPA